MNRKEIDLTTTDLQKHPLILSRIYLAWYCGLSYRDLEKTFRLVRRNGVTARRACALVDSMFHAPRQSDRSSPIAKAIALRLPQVNFAENWIEDDPFVAAYVQIEIQWRKLERINATLHEWTSAVLAANSQLMRSLGS